MNYLVVKLSSMGDIIMATPCLRAIRQHDPQAHIAMAIGREFLPLIEHNPHIDEILIRETRGKTRRLRTIVQAGTTLVRRRRPPFDVAFDLQGNFHSAAWVYCSGARTKAGIGERRIGWQVTVPPDLTRHSSELCAAVLRRCEIPVSNLAAELHLGPESDRQIERRLRQAGLPSGGFLLISPFSLWRSKEWPQANCVSLIHRLAASVNLPIVLTGSEADGRGANELLQLIEGSGAVSMIGALRLDEALCLYRRARIVVSGDSGPMHAAAALGTPVIALFGPTWPEVTGPLGTGHRVIQARRPPHHTTYRDPDSESYMAAIREDDVFEAVNQILLETTAAFHVAPS
jgi:heptosyltransferase I